MPLVTLVTDSSACVAPDWAAHPTLRLLPLGVALPEGLVDDGPEAALAVRDALAAGDPVRTVAPSPVGYLQVLDDCAGGAVVVTPAADVAVMHRNAMLAARLHAGDVVVVDSGTAGPAHGLCVVAGLRAAVAGATTAEVAEAVATATRRVGLVAMVPDLARVGAAAAGAPPTPLAGTARPAVFRFLDGVPAPLPSTPGDPLDALVTAWAEDGGTEATDAVVFHADDEAGAVRLAERVSAGSTGGTAAVVVPISPAMSVHTGPGCVGVAWARPAL